MRMRIKNTVIILSSFLIIIYSTLGINKNYIFLAFTLPIASLCSLLTLNTAVLYIYIKYFVSPQVNRQNKQNSIVTDHFRPLRLTHRSTWPQFQKPTPKVNISLTKDDKAIDAAFDTLLKYVMRDFIQSWYVKITGNLDEQTFPTSVENIIRKVAANISNRLEQADLLQLLVIKLIPRITSHISDFRTAEIALRGKSLERSVTQSDELDLLLASRFRASPSSTSKGGKGLHKALTSVAMTTTKPTEIAYLRQLLNSILPLLIDTKDIDSGPVKVIIREIVSNSVLQPVLDMLADPDFWNQMIDTYLGKAIMEQKMVKQLREVLDRHSTTHDGIDPEDIMDDFLQTSKKKISKKSSTSILANEEDSPDYKNKSEEGDDALFNDPTESDANDYLSMFSRKKYNSSNNFFKIPLYDSTNTFGIKSHKKKEKRYSMLGRRSFQDFLQTIQEEKNLLDLKRVRNDIMTQIRKKKAQITDRDPEEIVDGEKVEDILLYVSRLSIAKKRVDKRIATLSGEQFDLNKSSLPMISGESSNDRSLDNTRKQSLSHVVTNYYTLRDILTNTSGLSYFMEFMDRREDVIKLQFWLIVEGFNNTETITIEEKKTFLKDVRMVYEMYFDVESNAVAQHRLLHHATDPLVSDLKEAIRLAEESLAVETKSSEKNNAVFVNHISELHLCLRRIQQHVFWEIEKEHFPYFKRSDLYFKFLSSAPPVATSNEAGAYQSRRSLDETTLYKSSNSNNDPHNTVEMSLSTSTSTTSIHRLNINNRPASVHETSLSSPAKVLATPTLSTSRLSTNDFNHVKNNKLASAQLKASLSVHYGKTRGHQRALSDSTSKPPSNSRFLSFSNMFTASRLWNYAPDRQEQHATNYSSSSVPSSIKSLDVTTEDDDYDDDEVLDVDHKEEPRPARLVRSNTVEAVEAELRSILDGKISTDVDDALVNSDEQVIETDKNIPNKQCKTTAKKPQSLPTTSLSSQSIQSPPPALKPSLSSTLPSSALLLGRSKGTKSSTAVPVQHVYALPSWTSSGGTKTISEIEHDKLESIVPPTNKINSTSNNNKLLSSTDNGKNEEILAALVNETNIANNDKKESPTSSIMSQDDNCGNNEALASSNVSNNVHFAPPGDLMLATKVQQLSEEMEKLKGQEAIVDALIIKAESQNKVEELRILKKSKTIFRQELQQIEYQKLQYELQEIENVLIPNRSQVKITNATMGTDQHGEFALLYVIEIQQLDVNNNFASGWIVARRYSEFFSLHQQLKEKYPRLKIIEFPAKWPSLLNKLQRSFVEARRISLERYLRTLMEDHEICQSQELRSFLSQQNTFAPSADNPTAEWPLVGGRATTSSSNSSLQSLILASSSSSSPSVQNLQKSIATIDNYQNNSQLALQKKPSKGFMRHIYKTVAAGIDDILVEPSMLDLITHRLGEQVTGFSSEGSNNHQANYNYNNTNAQISATDDLSDSLKTENFTRFTEPLCDLFIEMFELKDKTNWLRRQAVVIIIQQILEGTIERKLKETFKYVSSSSMIVSYFDKLMDSLWPGGESLRFKEPRKLEEKIHTREEANRKLSTWLPDLLGNMVGRQNARKGSRRLFTVLQNKRLNQDLVYTLLDEIIYALFPELIPVASAVETK
ncbi:MAG: PXA domain-containing protein [Benjaminiella poitrasii]|nr:MAG: PXA domain-containing protein [Benjaminiella poitrasii]